MNRNTNSNQGKLCTAQTIKAAADAKAAHNPLCAEDAMDALSEFGGANFLADSNEGQSTVSFSPNRAYLCADGSVYEITHSGANAYLSLQEAAFEREYINKAVQARNLAEKATFTEKSMSAKRFQEIAAALLKKHYGLELNDTHLHDEQVVAECIQQGYRPYQVVAEHVEEADLDRIDKADYGVPSKATITATDEDAAIQHLPIPSDDIGPRGVIPSEPAQLLDKLPNGYETDADGVPIDRKLQENEFYSGIAVGSQVYWEDPDEGISSGYYTVHEIFSEDGEIEGDNTMLMLKNDAGSNCEVFAHELRATGPEVGGNLIEKREYRFKIMLPAEHPANHGKVDAGRRFLKLSLSQDEFEDHQGLKDRIYSALSTHGISQSDRPDWNESPEVPDGFEERLREAIGADEGTQFIAHYPHGWHHRTYKSVDVDGVPCVYQSFQNDHFIKWAPSMAADPAFLFAQTGKVANGANFDPELPEEVWLSGQRIIRGNAHLGVIYNNLIGVNIADANEYATYINFMVADCGFLLPRPGDRFEFRSHGQTITACSFGDTSPERVTEQLRRDVLNLSAKKEDAPSP